MDWVLSSWVELLDSNFIEFDFGTGTCTVNQNALKEDLIDIMLKSEELQDSIVGEVPATGAVMDELLGESSQGQPGLQLTL